MKRLLAGFIIVAVLPLVALQTGSHSVGSPSRGLTALAGHSNGTERYCSCTPAPDGSCQCCGAAPGGGNIVVQPNDDASGHSAPVGAGESADLADLPGALLFLIALLAWTF